MTHPARSLVNKAQKPMRGSLLNRTHPLARGLVESFLFNQLAGTYVGNLLDWPNGFTWHASNNTWKGNGIHQVGGANLGYIVAVEPYPTAADLNSTAFTVVAKCYSELALNSLKVIIGNDLNASGWSVWTYTNGDLGIYTRNTFGTSNTGVVFQNTWHTLAWAFDGVTTCEFYVDGINVGTDATLLLPTAPAAASEFTIGNDPRDQGGLGWGGYTEYIHLYNRQLSVTEIALLHREPYCMF